MPVFELFDDRPSLTGLKPTKNPPGRHKVEISGRYSMQYNIELTDGEYADWLRVEAEYFAWREKLERLRLAAPGIS